LIPQDPPLATPMVSPDDSQIASSKLRIPA
jgi:hypothetical protein